MMSPFHSPAFVQQSLTTPLSPFELPPETILEGAPKCFQATVLTGGAANFECGIWEITPGVVSDVEADEIFLVLTGVARVEIGDAPTLHLSPGSMGVLRRGDRTVWHVTETLRKIYIQFTPTDAPHTQSSISDPVI